MKSDDFMKKLRYAACGSHIESLHASAVNRQIIIKNRPLNTAGILGGDNKVLVAYVNKIFVILGILTT